MTEKGPGSLETDSVDWEDRKGGRAKRFLLRAERITLRAERPVEAVVGRSQFNPLYYTGPITVLLFAIVFATGLYLTMFYRFGFDASYESVADIEANLVGRFVRAAHRYGSIALVVTALLHGWRTLVMDRFRGPRRLSWLTGVAMVALLWIIGVTGYWLIWDERAQVLNESLTRVARVFPAGLDFLLDFVLTDAAGTGWPFLLLLFFIHVGISVGVAVLLWVHLKRLARAIWLPPAFWAIVMGGSLVVMSLVWPVGMLPALSRARLPSPVPIDPFFLFLLPGSVTWPPALLWGGALVTTATAMFLPWLIRRRPAPPIAVDEERCNGCTLCVADCPYDALRMVDVPDGPHPQLAVVTEDRCVGCGICVGGCPVNALAFPDHPADTLWEEVASESSASTVVFTCERHVAHSNVDPAGARVVALPCVGMAHPDLIASATESGAKVRVIGCPPGDCTNREGSLTEAARLARRRRPRLRRRYLKAGITTDWVAPTRLETALANPGAASDPAPAPAPGDAMHRSVLPLVGLIAVTAVATVLATQLVFDPGGNDTGVITISLDHRAGVTLEGFAGGPGSPTGEAPRLVVESDGRAIFDEVLDLVSADDPGTAVVLERFDVDPGVHRVGVTLYDDPSSPLVLFDDTVAIGVGEALVLDFRDVPVVDPAEAGRALFNQTALGTNAGCGICHSLDAGRELVGPSLAGVATRAASTGPGLTAEEYLRQSILQPDAYVVPEYPQGQMLGGLEDTLTPREIDNLIAFLLTLEEGEGE